MLTQFFWLPMKRANCQVLSLDQVERDIPYVCQRSDLVSIPDSGPTHS